VQKLRTLERASSEYSAQLRLITALTQEAVTKQKKAKGLRVDLRILPPQGPELLIDVGTTHHGSSSVLAPSLHYHTNVHKAEIAMHGLAMQRMPNREPSPPVARRVKKKKDTYGPLMLMLHAQKYLGVRERAAEFYAPIISLAGEFSPDVFALTERLASVLKQRYQSSYRPLDGYTASEASARFRTNLKDALAATVLKGYGRMLWATMATSSPAAS
jgi:hypothetical protein